MKTRQRYVDFPACEYLILIRFVADGPGGGGGVLGSIFAGYVPLAPPSPYPIIVYSVANYRPHVSHFWANIPQIPICRNLLTP